MSQSIDNQRAVELAKQGKVVYLDGNGPKIVKTTDDILGEIKNDIDLLISLGVTDTEILKICKSLSSRVDDYNTSVINEINEIKVAVEKGFTDAAKSPPEVIHKPKKWNFEIIRATADGKALRIEANEVIE